MPNINVNSYGGEKTEWNQCHSGPTNSNGRSRERDAVSAQRTVKEIVYHLEEK